jgi:hypothetical protein
MKIPNANDVPLNMPSTRSAYILNPCPNKEYLTTQEALSVISQLSSMLAIDYNNRIADGHEQR